MTMRRNGQSKRRVPMAVERVKAGPVMPVEPSVGVPEPRSLRALDPDTRSVLREMQAAAGDLAVAELQLARRAIGARDAGVSWSAIGWAVGLTGEGARKRWGRAAASAGAGEVL